MSIFWILVIILILANLGGGQFLSGYGSGPYYGYSWGGIIVVIVILYLVLGRGGL